MRLAKAGKARFFIKTVLMFYTFCSFVFLCEVFERMVNARHFSTGLLSTFCFSFTCIVISTVMPSRFVVSVAVLLYALCVANIYVGGKEGLAV